MAQTKLMGKAKVQYEKGEGPQGASVTMDEPKGKKKAGGKLGNGDSVSIRCVKNGYVVDVYRGERGGGRGIPTEAENFVAADLDDLDEIVDGLLGVVD